MLSKNLAKGYVLHPNSVTNSYFTAGNFGGYLSNRKTDTLNVIAMMDYLLKKLHILIML